jgi:hypothetical protein
MRRTRIRQLRPNRTTLHSRKNVRCRNTAADNRKVAGSLMADNRRAADNHMAAHRKAGRADTSTVIDHGLVPAHTGSIKLGRDQCFL